MIRIRVEYYGPFEDALNKCGEQLALEDGSTVGVLIDVLTGLEGAAFRKMVLDESNELQLFVHVFVNYGSIDRRTGLAVKLSDGDLVQFAVPMVGGSS